MIQGYYDRGDRERRIRILQRMLRAVTDVSLEENGQYDGATRSAVQQFQRSRGFPTTGITDRHTWEELSRLYAENQTSPVGIRPFAERDRKIFFGERSDLVMIVQMMLNELRYRYDSYGHIPLSGILDGETGEAVRRFQRMNRLREDGIIDVHTWNRMAEQYNDILRRGEL